MNVNSDATCMKAPSKGLSSPKRGQSDAESIDEQGARKVLHDDSFCSARHPEGLDKLRQIVAEQHDPSALSSNIAMGSEWGVLADRQKTLSGRRGSRVYAVRGVRLCGLPGLECLAAQ